MPSTGGAPDLTEVSGWLRARWPLDRLVAGVMALPLSVIVAALAVVVRRRDAGPGIVRLTRVGRGGDHFGILKLRSMRVGHAGPSADGPPLTGGGDERITPIGGFLRRYRLDEFPQVFNVIAGHMALIGPRPETPEYVDETDPRWQSVLKAKPAIIGPTQVLVHHWENDVLAGNPDRVYREVVLPVKLAIDIWYIRNATPWVDVLVVTSLLQQFVLRRRDTVLQRRLAAEVPEARPLCAAVSAQMTIV